MSIQVQGVYDEVDLGVILNLDWRTWKNWVEGKYDSEFVEAGGTLPADKDPSQNYTGDKYIACMPLLTRTKPDEAVKIKALIMGKVIICSRQLDEIYIIDRETKQVVWRYSGEYLGGISRAHEPYMIKKGLPGAGNILLYDNGTERVRTERDGKAAVEEMTVVLEINPVSKQIVWLYQGRILQCYPGDAAAFEKREYFYLRVDPGSAF